jgi:hypothetical protein
MNFLCYYGYLVQSIHWDTSIFYTNVSGSTQSGCTSWCCTLWTSGHEKQNHENTKKKHHYKKLVHILYSMNTFLMNNDHFIVTFLYVLYPEIDPLNINDGR